MSFDPALPGQPYPLVDPRTGLISLPWYNSFVRIANDVVALGPAATSATIEGWPASTGGARITINGAFTQVASAGYSQANTQALNNQVAALSQALAQLINDLETFGVIG
jgi:hypothetical protein